MGAGVMGKKRFTGLIGWMALWLCMGCKQAANQQPAQVEIKDPPPTPIAEEKAELGKPTWEPEWDKIVEEALPAEMLSSEVARAVRPFCPRFNSMSEVDKRAYWAYFFQALAGVEAGLKPTADVRHTEPEVAVEDAVTKRRVRSEGLLQLTYMDAERYGCDFDWETDRKLKANDPAKTILQPKNNLECGVTILDKQIIDSHKPLLWRSGYWSTLRPGGESYRVFAKQMTNVPAACGVGVAKGKKRTGQDGVTTEQLAATR